MAPDTEPSDQIDVALRILKKHRVIVVSGRQGVGKSTFSLGLGEALSSSQSIPLLGASGDQYRQHASFHPFEHHSYLESLRKSGGPLVRMGSAVATAIDPTGRIVYPVYQAIKDMLSAHQTASTGFTKEEVEGARRFATVAETERVFIFDNFHYWDKNSLEFARKVITSRKPLGLYVIVVWTEHDVVESVNAIQEVLAIVPRTARYRYDGLSKEALRYELLADLPRAGADIILSVAGANIPLIKHLIRIARRYVDDPDLETKVAEAAVELKVESLMDVPRIGAEQRALGCVAAIGPGASIRDIACALDLSIDETGKALQWGERHGLIDVLDARQVAFVHDLYQRLFDVDDILAPRFLQKINLCCALGIPDEYEKRAQIASRGQDKESTLTLVISSLRQCILSWNETKSDLSEELERIGNLIGGKYADELGALSRVLNNGLANAARGEFEKAAWAMSISDICSHPHAYLEEAVLFAHYAYLSRDNKIRSVAVQKLKLLRDTAEGEAERSFIVSMMLAYGLSLGNELKEATAIFAEEEARLAVSSDRFKEAPFYIAICERMSLTCYENSLARRRLERGLQTFQRLLGERGFLKKPDELLKCASNLCSAYVIGGMPERAEEVLKSVEIAISGIDFNWSTAPAFLANNTMVAAIHRGQVDFESSAETWRKMAKENAHLRLPFLVNALGCFIEAEAAHLNELRVHTIIDNLQDALSSNPDGEAFMCYMAHFSIWQAMRAFDLKGDAEQHLAQASKNVLEIPYVNGDHFRTRHKALLSSMPTEVTGTNQVWHAQAFGPLPDADLPLFYRRVVHFNPLEHWLPS
ncbi:MAG: hypothetical protein ACSHXI_22430 [Hoeflea sp.]|uniref:hypothetical protein n=1 Tax=Hoeflea sp. TaxID=1940281 RepID=UPI003EF4AE6C